MQLCSELIIKDLKMSYLFFATPFIGNDEKNTETTLKDKLITGSKTMGSLYRVKVRAPPFRR